ncbi:MAG: lipopolysaccharide biosynthesis protein [Bacteroides sp.]|nr:lipopolysaccharide biosynthesis protein [Bacteroides sp.]
MKNTFLLYVRMLGLMLVTLLTTRIVLKELGENDYGIYNVVGGVVIVFSIFSSSLTAAISRFLTYELGKGSDERLNDYFSNSVILQIILGLIICVIIEFGGTWFLNNKMNIAYDMLESANIVLQCSILIFFINLISTPYNAVIIAHERMSTYAALSILDVLLKLLAAYLISYVNSQRLVYYSIFLVIEAFAIRMIYSLYCRRVFEECNLKWRINGAVFRELLAFSGWNFIGASSGILKDQGVNLLLNIFGNTIINAARGLSMQVGSAATSFTSSFVTALNPQITKEYAIGNKTSSIILTVRGAKFSVFLVWFIALPILLETDTLLAIWLTEIPNYTPIFVRLSIVYVVIETFSMTLITLMLATGNIKKYQIIVGGMQLLNFPFSWIALYLGIGYVAPYYIAICISLVCLNIRLYLLWKMVKLSIRTYYRETVLPAVLVIIISSVIPFCLELYMYNSTFKFFIVISMALISTSLSIYYVGLNQNERIHIKKILKRKLGRYAY